MSLPLVAIVGRPNVGKSTLFNRLCGFKKAVVHDRPGVTRDRIYEETELLTRDVRVVDTGGIEADPDTDLLKAMRRQTMLAVDEADVIVFLVDAQSGYTPADQEVASLLRRTEKPVLLAVNKIDGPKHEELVADFWQLGFEPITVSAAHGRGTYELLEAIEAKLPAFEAVDEAVDDDGWDDEDDDAPSDEVPWDEDEDEDAEGEGDPDADADDEGFSADANSDEAAWEYTFEASDDVGEDALEPGAAEAAEAAEAADDDDEEKPGVRDPIKIAVIGRPNIGKSTLINRLLGEDRHLVLDMPGTTMDPVDSALEVAGRKYLLVDTAGVRKKSQIKDALERFVSLRSIKAIERCHVTLLLIDGTEGLTDQDARLVQLVVERGRALVVLINKWDLAKELEQVNSKVVDEELLRRLPHASWARHLYISAKTGKGCGRILDEVETAFAAFNRRVPTARLNRFLEEVTTHYTPPQRHHHPVRLYYMTQTRVRPPTFAVFSNTPEGVTAPYQRYLQNQIRDRFAYWGTPIKLHFRKRRGLGEDKAR